MSNRAPLTFLVDAIRAHAHERPDSVALLDGDDRITYSSLNTQSNQVARGLAGLGIGKGDRVCYLAKNSHHFFQVLVGAMKIGAVMTPINWRLAPPELAQIINDSEAKLIFVSLSFLGTLDQLRPQLRTVQHIRVLGGSRADHSGFEPWRDGQEQGDLATPMELGEVAIQLYTSGTTGRPKGVMLSHRTYKFAMGSPEWPKWTHWTADEVLLIVGPLFHLGAVARGIRGLFIGAQIAILDKFSAEGVLEAIERYRATRLGLVPSTLQLLLRHPKATQTDFTSLRHLQYGAAPIETDLLLEARSMLKCDLVQSYGLTESGAAIVSLNPEDHDPGNSSRLRAAGRPLPGVEIKIADSAGERCKPGEVGEVLIRSPSNMLGYWKLPAETAAALDGDGWLHTGDAGHVDLDGYLYINGRITEMIVTGGENVFPAEVENALFGHPAVKEVAVIGVPSEKWGEEIRAYVALKDGVRADQESLLAYARQRIAGYKLPKSVEFVEALPRNAAGKVLRKELRSASEPPKNGRVS